MAAPPFFIPLLPQPLAGFPVTAYSIAYDIFTLANELDLPQGWNSPRANIYRQLKRLLLIGGFTRNQYSVWVNPNVTVLLAWNVLWSLETAPPPNKLSSTVKGLHISRMDQFALMDVTADVQIGGANVPNIRGPVPRDLVPQPLALQPPAGPIPPNAAFARPVHTRPSPAANDRNNYYQ
ncbi:hypothetical protein R3P38DRAFT_1897168 [Favolaschia claudopus]|uniref:Uncharacterized protein n=1 Tax=Favolaschia claudopus TaxID=2862362 RepID=A0AAW0A2D4_9AGAR